jgi:hypothetical protein
MRTQIVIAFLLGITVTLLAVLVFGQRTPALAQGAGSGVNSGSISGAGGGGSSSGGMIGVPGTGTPGGENILWLVDAKGDTPRLCIYEWTGKKLLLRIARNIRYDFMMDNWPDKGRAQEPSVKDVYNKTEKLRKDARNGKKG